MIVAATPKRCLLVCRKPPLPMKDPASFWSNNIHINHGNRFILNYDEFSVSAFNAKDIEVLYSHGYFGKCTLSKGYPNFKLKTGDKVTEVDKDINCETILPKNQNVDESITEELHLSLEEAFFLSFGLKCASIISNQIFVSDAEVWKLFQKKQPDFIQRYIAYHYFRAKGWVVRSGLKYGADFVLYKEGPPFYHSSFTVFVISNLTKRNDQTIRLFLTRQRVSETVKKVFHNAIKLEDVGDISSDSIFGTNSSLK